MNYDHTLAPPEPDGVWVVRTKTDTPGATEEVRVFFDHLRAMEFVRQDFAYEVHIKFVHEGEAV